MVAARRAGRLGQCAKTICHSLAALARVDAVVAVVGLGGVVGVVGLAACPGGEPAAHDTLPGDGGDAWQTLASGAWSAAEAPLGTSLAPAVAGVGRPGDLLAPESLAVTAGGVLVLDPARARIVRIAADGKGDIARSDPRLADATDLAAATDGALWVARGGGVARIAADGGWLDVALAPELVGSMLVATADGLVVGDPGAARVSPVVAGGQALDLDAQRATAPADAALGWSVELALDGLARATLRAPDGAAHAIDLPGAPLAVELFAARTACGSSELALVVKVLRADGAAHAVLRVGLDGQVRATRVAPAPAAFHVPFRAFALGPDGALVELRLEPDGWTLATWEVGCES